MQKIEITVLPSSFLYEWGCSWAGLGRAKEYPSQAQALLGLQLAGPSQAHVKMYKLEPGQVYIIK